MSDKGPGDSLWTSLLEGLVDRLGTPLIRAVEQNPADPVTRMEPVRQERRLAGEEAIFRATEGARGTAPMERVSRERRYVARAMADRQAAGAMATRVASPPPPPPSVSAAHSQLYGLMEAANHALKTLGVPGMNIVFGAGVECLFSCQTWAMMLPGAFFAGAPPPEWRIELAAGCYHEARHAEQYFNIARMLAGQGRSVLEISAACQGMDPAKVQLACSNPMLPTDPRAPYHQQMFDDLTANLGLLAEVQIQKGPAEAFAAAWQQAVDSNSPSEPRLRAAFETVMVTFKPLLDRYHAVAAEADATALEARVRALWT